MTSHPHHIVSHIRKPELQRNNVLHVVAMVSNTVRYHSRYRLFRQWLAEMEQTPNVKVYVVEIAYGDRAHEVTEAGNPTHLQLRTKQEIWHKENALNLGVRHLLPLDWKYLCWCDADVTFRNPAWAQETMHQLQHFDVVQPWQDAIDLGFEGNVLSTYQSFCYVNRLGVPMKTHPNDTYRYGHTGFAWACTRHFFENVGGLMDFPILGSSDHHCAWAMKGQVQHSLPGTVGEAYKRRCFEWQHKAFRITHGHMGYVAGRIEHHFHGSKKKRYYQERWQLFAKNHFCPDKHLMYDDQGLLVMINNVGMLDDIRRYMRARHEDSIDE